MNRIFQKLPLPVKLMLIGLIPLLFLIYFSVQIINEKSERVEITSNVIRGINNTLAVMELASNLHVERRMGFAHGFNKITSSELLAQYAKTDVSLANVEKLLGTSVKNYSHFTLLDKLDENRKNIIHKRISPDEILIYYSNLLTRVSSLSTTSADIPYLSSIKNSLKGQKVIFQFANSFGILRANIYSAAVSNRSDKALERISQEHDLLLSYWTEFSAVSSKSEVGKYLEINKTPEGLYVNGLLSQIIQNKAIPQAFNADKWWENSGIVVAQIREVQAELTSKTRKEAEVLQENGKDDLNRSILFLTVVILVVVMIVFYATKSITSKLLEIREAAEIIALGGTGISLKIETDDAIGSLAKSIQAIDASNNNLANAADAIGKGEFDVEVKPRSKDDILGNAILSMKKDLSVFAKESSEKIWVQTGLTTINDSIKGEKQLHEITDHSLAALINYMQAQLGLFYVSNNDILEFSSGYAIPTNYSVTEQIRLGETLIGQSARQHEIFYLEDVPDNYVKISTGSGQSSPRHLLIIPLVHNDIIEGVIEIGSFHPFPPGMKTLIEQGAANIAIAIHTAKSRAKLQELLEETQSQSEELQAQHSELENLNTELEAQAQKLQASEEELKVQQEELLEANEELKERSNALEEKNQVIVERNLEIQKKAEELEVSTKYKSEFLANMSHELRTPLNSILLLSRLMSENTEQNLTEDQIEYAKVIQSSGNGLLALIDEILDLSKIEAGKMDLEFEETSVKGIVGDMRALFSPIAQQKNLELGIEIEEGTPEAICTDKMRLEQILKNLLSNALKFTSRGHVKLAISRPENGSLIKFSVIDSGIGIPEEKQHQVFEAFQQADGSTRRKYGGTGLGLSISRELSKLLGGEIQLESELNKGSKFTVTLPVNGKVESEQAGISTNNAINAAQTPIIETPKTEAAPRKFIVNEIPRSINDDRENLAENDKPVLIIEDDTNFAKALLQFTRKSGYKGIVAVEGAAGVQMAQAYKPVAILLDIQLPVKDGWEVMEELKSNPSTRHIPVHIMSSMEAKKESLIKGAVDFVNKPIRLEQMQGMFSKLEDALNRQPKKVLIIEENTKHAEALSYFLDTFNISSEIKGSVNDGIAALQNDTLDCVILDMGIPDQNVYETLEAVKKNKGLENLPIIVFTGKNLSAAEESRLKHYADSIVMKTAHSYQRILDEVGLFLHLIQEKNLKDDGQRRKNLIELNEVLRDKTVLIADDDVRNIFSLTKALEQVRMTVLSATDGKEAIRILNENPQTNVVLMDMMMPEMDGYESTTKIRQNPKYKNLPILAVTAKAMLGDREKCIKAGASDYISKPVDIDQLISLLRVWLYDKNY